MKNTVDYAKVVKVEFSGMECEWLVHKLVALMEAERKVVLNHQWVDGGMNREYHDGKFKMKLYGGMIEKIQEAVGYKWVEDVSSLYGDVKWESDSE